MDALPHARNKHVRHNAVQATAVRNKDLPTAVRVVTGLLLGMTVGAVAALVTPRRPQSSDDDGVPTSPPR